MIDIPTFPMKLYHPIYGAREAKDAKEAQELFVPATDWFKTAAEADMHRTAHEADIVVAQTRQIALEKHQEKGVVLNSVTHQETADDERKRGVENTGDVLSGTGQNRAPNKDRQDTDAAYSVANRGEKEQPIQPAPTAEQSPNGDHIEAGV